MKSSNKKASSTSPQIVRESHYQTLNVVMTATQEEIKASYRSLALKYHPDKCTDADAELKMKNINEAYKVLSNEAQRKKYDLLFETGGNLDDLSEESFEYEEEIMQEIEDSILNNRWKKIAVGTSI